jgi:NADH:ubiquinone oxidoreductase subunit E
MEVNMKVTVCIGSACHVKGAGKIVEQLQSLVAQHTCGDRVELAGAFCMGKCGATEDGKPAVSVMVDDTYHLLQPENTKAFFEKQVLKKAG